MPALSAGLKAAEITAPPRNVIALPKRRPSKAVAELDKAVAIIAGLEAKFGVAFPDECLAAIEFLLNREAA